ncbi:DnaJ C-terminal domain-containing protein [Magnetospirillum sp. UT-4]|uniref:DnaJ C-terminal domain-containing protein n=1 Tax=Magnetospirillum sp. UT-4 TaxID=2681467 RepID=UPI00137F8F86|nr:J domain-containing protein [Magnetospirillum sp. UT-4]CAA7614711.1 Curved DNA-binding protein, DnaJ homologue that functions as a co-chaperone of DnaK [Magnetospirillum sp. UT-4]
MKDPYSVLGVAREASDDEIKSVYRKLARKLHPDVNPGDAKAEERFKEISAAYDFLSDPERRGQYDRGEIDATGAARRRQGWRAHAGNARGTRSGSGFGASAEDILAEMMRRKQKAKAGFDPGGFDGWHDEPPPGPKRKGAEARHPLSVSFTEAALGGTRRVTLVSGKALDVRIPAGTTDGQSLRLKGQGHPGLGGAEAGDAYVDIKVEPHPFFTRRDRDVLLDLPVSVQEAVLGAKVTVPTLDGKVVLSVPAAANTGTVLRLKGKGIGGSHPGDLLVTLKVVLPDGDSEFAKLVEKWGPRHGYDPRAKAGMG